MNPYLPGLLLVAQFLSAEIFGPWGEFLYQSKAKTLCYIGEPKNSQICMKFGSLVPR